jgi:hypothetical protein
MQERRKVMGLLFAEPVPPRPPRPRKGGLLFAEKHTSAAIRSTKKPPSDVADDTIVAVFSSLQKIWRRQGTLRRTYQGMRSSQEECEAWRQLIEYLTKKDAGDQ